MVVGAAHRRPTPISNSTPPDTSNQYPADLGNRLGHFILTNVYCLPNSIKVAADDVVKTAQGRFSALEVPVPLFENTHVGPCSDDLPTAQKAWLLLAGNMHREWQSSPMAICIISIMPEGYLSIRLIS
jgi:hypothetical protein